MAESIPFTPEQNARMNEAMAILFESNQWFERFLSNVEKGFGKECALEFRKLDRRVQWSNFDETNPAHCEQLQKMMMDILHQAIRKKIVDDFVNSFDWSSVDWESIGKRKRKKKI